MAAIDKMYLTGDEFDELRRWAIVYYPKLFLEMTYPFISNDEIESWQKTNHQQKKEYAIRDYNRYHGENGLDGVVKALSESYDEDELTSERLGWIREDAQYIVNAFDDVNKPGYDEEYYDETIPLLRTSFKTDKYLLWHCPVDCVRKYLETNCGYKTKWYHKIFWRGKRWFLW